MVRSFILEQYTCFAGSPFLHVGLGLPASASGERSWMDSVSRNTFWRWECGSWRRSRSRCGPVLFSECRSLWRCPSCPPFLDFPSVCSTLLGLSRCPCSHSGLLPTHPADLHCQFFLGLLPHPHAPIQYPWASMASEYETGGFIFGGHPLYHCSSATGCSCGRLVLHHTGAPFLGGCSDAAHNGPVCPCSLGYPEPSPLLSGCGLSVQSTVTHGCPTGGSSTFSCCVGVGQTLPLQTPPPLCSTSLGESLSLFYGPPPSASRPTPVSFLH